VAGGVAGWIIAFLLFLLIYTVLPSRPLRLQDAWRGALIAGALLELYDIAFPLYAAHFLKPYSYESTAGFADAVSPGAAKAQRFPLRKSGSHFIPFQPRQHSGIVQRLPRTRLPRDRARTL
jgi:hypothetical protein